VLVALCRVNDVELEDGSILEAQGVLVERCGTLGKVDHCATGSHHPAYRLVISRLFAYFVLTAIHVPDDFLSLDCKPGVCLSAAWMRRMDTFAADAWQRSFNACQRSASLMGVSWSSEQLMVRAQVSVS
jgi:hypothetical protein